MNTKQYQKVRYQLHKRIGNYLAGQSRTGRVKMLPVDIKTEIDANYTFLHISGEDTPAFLYSLANALTLKDINIQEVHIQTEKNRVNDVIAITDRYDRPITNTEYLSKLKVAIVLIKQFHAVLAVCVGFGSSDSPV